MILRITLVVGLGGTLALAAAAQPPANVPAGSPLGRTPVVLPPSTASQTTAPQVRRAPPSPAEPGWAPPERLVGANPGVAGDPGRERASDTSLDDEPRRAGGPLPTPFGRGITTPWQAQ